MIEKYLIADDGLRQFPKDRQIPDKRPKTFILFPFEMHAKMRESFDQKEAESFELIKNHLKIFKKCHVMSSHGSDSIVLVDLIRRAGPRAAMNAPPEKSGHVGRARLSWSKIGLGAGAYRFFTRKLRGRDHTPLLKRNTATIVVFQWGSGIRAATFYFICCGSIVAN